MKNFNQDPHDTSRYADVFYQAQVDEGGRVDISTSDGVESFRKKVLGDWTEPPYEMPEGNMQERWLAAVASREASA